MIETGNLDALIKKHCLVCGVKHKMKWVLAAIVTIGSFITTSFGWAMFEQSKTAVHAEQILTLQNRFNAIGARDERIEQMLKKILENVEDEH
jgi:hypothetical protein